MSAPLRGRGGGGPTTRGAKTTATTVRGRGAATRGRGRGRGAAGTAASTDAGGLLQRMRSGTVQRGDGEAAAPATRGRGTTPRGRGSNARTFSTGKKPRSLSPAPKPLPTPTPSASNHRDFMSQMTERYNLLKSRRDAERKRAIRDGFLADPEQKTSLDKAITPVGTCTEMCPEFERVERIVQNMVDKAEKISVESSERDMPSEDRMVKRFRRSAAGYDEQLPSDIRTPETLQRALDYLLDKVIGVERLASIHKFVWDRTRGIRNDFSIQQVSRLEDVRIAVDCYERIARFHILSMHQLSNPDNLLEGEHFERQQEREQLNNTLLSLMYYYDDHRASVDFPNEPEFRAYCILFELQSLHPDLEERMQSWPRHLLDHPKVRTAFKLYAAAGNSIFDQGPLRPLTPYLTAQANLAKFWTILDSHEVSYMMACVAEMNFNQVRFVALDALWRANKSAPQGQQARNQDWTIGELTDYLGFDEDEQTVEFAGEFGLAFANSNAGEEYLDFTALSTHRLDKSSIPSDQVFSTSIVEGKRYRRTLVAVINGVNVATAVREGLVVDALQDHGQADADDDAGDENSLFIPETADQPTPTLSPTFGSGFHPQASTFVPGAFGSSMFSSQKDQKQPFGTIFGCGNNEAPKKPVFGSPSPAFTPQATNSDIQATPQSDAFAVVTPPLAKATEASLFNTVPATNPFKGFAAFQPTSGATGSSSQSGFPALVAAQSSQTPSTSNLFQLGSKSEKSPGQSGFKFAPPTTSATPATLFKPAEPAEARQPQTQASIGFPSGHAANPSVLSAPEKPADTTLTVPRFSFLKPTEASGASSQKPTFASQNGAPLFSYQTAKPAPNESKPTNALQDAAQAPTPQITKTPNFQFNPPAAPIPPASTTENKSAPLFQSTNSIPSVQFSGGPQPSAAQTPTFPFTPQGTPQKATPPFSFAVSSHPNNDPAPIITPSTALFSPENKEKNSEAVAHTVEQPVLTPKLSPPKPQGPSREEILKAKKAALIDTTASLLLSQSQGLMEYFVSNHISKVVHEVARKFEVDERDRILTFVRTQHLSRKFFHLWKGKVQKKVLQKRAQHRRSMLAAAMKVEQQRRRRKVEELEAIIQATQETKKLQEQFRRETEEEKQKKMGQSQSQRVSQTDQPAANNTRKRKDFANNDDSRSTPDARASTPNRVKMHKRSKTVGSISDPLNESARHTSTKSSSIAGQSTPNNRYTQLFLGRSTSSQDLARQGQRSAKSIDGTKTDYFKLKAMGIDPSTSLVPDTARSLALRQQRDIEERQSILAKFRARRGELFSGAKTPANSGKAMSPPPKTAPQRDVPQSTNKLLTGTKTEEDDLLKELREAREAMSQDAEWFKAQTETMEKEQKHRESIQRDLQVSRASTIHTNNLRLSSNGLARVNGYDFLPGHTKSGHSLSRTELRIRQTGAHGLATRSLTGSRNSSVAADYVPVAMSKRSASRLSTSSREDGGGQRQQQIETKRKGMSQDYPPTKRGRQDDDNNSTIRPQQVDRRSYSLNAFTALNNLEDEEKEEDHEDENEDDRSEVASEYEHEQGDGEGEEEDLDDSEADFDQDEDATRPHHQNQRYHHALPQEEPIYDQDNQSDGDGDDDDDDDDDDGYTDPSSGFGYPTISRGGGTRHGNMPPPPAGPGASQDDALVLSD